MSATTSSASSTSLNLLVATAGDLQKELSSGKLTSVDLVNACLDQIEQYDCYLHAMISKAPRTSLIEHAQKLDNERKTKVRGMLHGIPILIKDNIATLPELHMDTTAGSLALVDSKPKRNAAVITLVGCLLLGFQWATNKLCSYWVLEQSLWVRQACRYVDLSEEASSDGLAYLCFQELNFFKYVPPDLILR